MYEQLRHTIERIEQIDAVMLPALGSLIDLVVADLELGAHPFEGISAFPLYVAPWLAGTRQPAPPRSINLSTALACKTLQRAHRLRRRFPSMKKKWLALKESVERRRPGLGIDEALASVFLPHAPAGSPGDYEAFVGQANLMDEWFPYSSSHVLWALLRGGEEKAYTGTAYISVFAMLWSMHASDEGEGASIGLLPASAYVTNACWTVLDALCGVCEQRAGILLRLAETLEATDRVVSGPVEKARRVLPFRLDTLVTLLHEYGEVALSRDGFRACASSVERVASGLTPVSDPAVHWSDVRSRIAKALQAVPGTAGALAGDLASARRGVVDAVCEALEPPGAPSSAAYTAYETALSERLKKLGVVHPVPTFTDPGERERYWSELHRAALTARATCDVAVSELQTAVDACRAVTSTDAATLMRTLRVIAESNRRVAAAFRRPLKRVEAWCARVVVPREMAHATAEDWTAFDPSELIAAAEVAVKSRQIESPVMLEAIASRALDGFRKDGSWLAGQPFYLDQHLNQGAWAPTADSLWTLGRLLVTQPKLTNVDAHLEKFLEWLEVSRARFEVQELRGRPLPGALAITGWVSERQIRPERIDLWVTTFAINALLELRRLMEFRLWGLCEKRFTIIRSGPALEDIKAMDLGAGHKERLHARLAQMARGAQEGDDANAAYSMVLHGPPGSSKTAVAGAVAGLMWPAITRRMGSGLRLVRITPADFTRAGEAQIDYEARQIFDLLGHIRGATILFDEIDDLLRRREDVHPPSFLKLIVPAMLNRLQDLRDRAPEQEICFLIATNYVDHFEPALVRRGRIDRLVPLVYGDRRSRESIIEDALKPLRDHHGWAANDAVAELSKGDYASTDYWPFKTIESACREIIREAKAAEGQPDHPSRRQALLQGMARVLEEHAATVSFPYDDERIRAMQETPALFDEVLHYLFAGASARDDYLRNVGQMLGRAFKGKTPKTILDRANTLWTAQRNFA